MILDEIIAEMEHAKVQIQNEVYDHFGTNPQCHKCRLIAFRAEMEAMVRIWQTTAAQFEEFAPISSRAHRECATELRAKIGEGK